MRNYIFKDEKFQKWIYSVYDSIAKDNIESLRQKYLSQNEIDEINKQIEDF